MSTPSGAYIYGRFLRAWQDAMAEFARHVVAGFEGMPQPQAPATDLERWEKGRERLYAGRIANERRRGAAFVRQEALRVRRELGLDTPHPLRTDPTRTDQEDHDG